MGIVIQNCVQFKEKYPQCPQSYPQIHRLYTKNGHKCQKNIKNCKKYWYNKREQCEQVNNLWITGELITIWRTKRHENHHFSCRETKEKYWKQAIAEYEKRLGPYTKIDIIEVPDEKHQKI